MAKIFILITILSLASCSVSPIKNVNYSKFNAYSTSNPGNMMYEEIGPVFTEQSSSILTSCNELAQIALAELIGNVKQMGGNAVTNLKWEKKSELSSIPHCETEWGWFGLYIVGGFGSWVRDVNVSGTAIKLKEDESTHKPGSRVFFFDPNKSNQETAENLYSFIHHNYTNLLLD